MGNEKERRENIRINRSLEVSYRIIDKFMRSGSHSLDISLVGIRLVSLQRLEPGTVLEIEIRFVEVGKPIKTIGEVVWVTERKGRQFPYEIGIRFTKINAHDKEVLSNICKKLESEEQSDKMGWIT